MSTSVKRGCNSEQIFSINYEGAFSMSFWNSFEPCFVNILSITSPSLSIDTAEFSDAMALDT